MQNCQIIAEFDHVSSEAGNLQQTLETFGSCQERLAFFATSHIGSNIC